MKKATLINKIGLPILYISIWIALYFLPRHVFLMEVTDSNEPWLLLPIILFLLPFLVYTIAKQNLVSKENSKTLAYISVFLTIPFIFHISSEDKEELRIHGMETIGIIDKTKISRPSKNGPKIYYVQAKYIIDGNTYRTTYKNDEDIILMRLDTITVIYSSLTPQISEIKELVEYYGE